MIHKHEHTQTHTYIYTIHTIIITVRHRSFGKFRFSKVFNNYWLSRCLSIIWLLGQGLLSDWGKWIAKVASKTLGYQYKSWIWWCPRACSGVKTNPQKTPPIYRISSLFAGGLMFYFDVSSMQSTYLLFVHSGSNVWLTVNSIDYTAFIIPFQITQSAIHKRHLIRTISTGSYLLSLKYLHMDFY